MKKYLVLILVLILLLAAAGCGSETGESSFVTGFDTPEDAVITYLEGLRDSDLERMLSAFAIESFVENFDFEAMLNRIQAYGPWMEPRMPNVNEFITAMNIEQRRGSIVNAISFQYVALASPELDAARPQVMLEEDISDFVVQFRDNLNALDLPSLEILGFIPAETLSEHYLSELNQDNIARQAEVQGADQLESRVAVFELEGDRHFLFVDVVNFNGRWYIAQFGGNIGALVGISADMRGMITPETFDWYLAWPLDGFDLRDIMIPLE